MSCPHPRQARELRRRTVNEGRWRFQDQCLECGAAVGAPIDARRVPQPASIPCFDPRLKRRTARPTARTRTYQRHIRSAAFRRLRERVLARDSYTCARCQNPDAHQVHHRTYERFGDERLEDLETLCDDCHAAEHGMTAT